MKCRKMSYLGYMGSTIYLPELRQWKVWNFTSEFERQHWTEEEQHASKTFKTSEWAGIKTIEQLYIVLLKIKEH